MKPKAIRNVRINVLTLIVLLVFSVTVSTQPQSNKFVPSRTMLTSSQSALPSSFEVFGHGYGHGRGMGQWGALGMAVNFSDLYTTILSHYYGGTTLVTLSSVPSAIRVLIEETVGSPIVINSSGSFTVGTSTFNNASIEITGSSGNWTLSTGGSCGGTGLWTPVSQMSSVDVVPTAGSILNVCESGLLVGYRGSIEVDDTTSGSIAAVNYVSLNDYLDSVVPGEMPPYWGTLGTSGPNGEPYGFQALLAQAVAARSYVLASLNRFTIADICDTTMCQHYGGIKEENSLTTFAVGDTLNQVLEENGSVVSTEYSASTGGYTAGGTFPAVSDPGDSVCIVSACNTLHSWQLSISANTIANAYPSVGGIVAINILQRNGYGDYGGRVLSVEIVGLDGTITTTGDGLAGAVGLYSNWFTVPNYSGDVSSYAVLSSSGSVDIFNDSGSSTLSSSGQMVSVVSDYEGSGGWIVQKNGQVIGMGSEQSFSNTLGSTQYVVAAASGGLGLWLILNDGTLIDDGGALPLVKDGWSQLTSSVAGAIEDGPTGLWLLLTDGQILSYGTAEIYSPLGVSVVSGAKDPSGSGVFVLESSGEVVSVGENKSFGGLQDYGVLDKPVGIAPTYDGMGYLILTNTGSVYGFGDAPYFGDPVTLGPALSSAPVSIATFRLDLPPPIVLPPPGRCGIRWGIEIGRFSNCMPFAVLTQPQVISSRLDNFGILGLGYNRTRFIKH